MANGRQGRPPTIAPHGQPTMLTIRLLGETKNKIAEMADLYGLTISEYLQSLVERDAADRPT